jgi:hypothetical protein
MDRINAVLPVDSVMAWPACDFVLAAPAKDYVTIELRVSGATAKIIFAPDRVLDIPAHDPVTPDSSVKPVLLPFSGFLPEKLIIPTLPKQPVFTGQRRGFFKSKFRF